MTKPFFISTAIDYPSGPPHAGHLYEKIGADVFARWHRRKGLEVHFSTGLDCHGQKMVRTAAKRNQSPAELVAEMEILFRRMCADYSISLDDFILTTEPRHHKVVQKIFERVAAAGDIYPGHYEGHYCTECETFYTPKDAPDQCCPVHRRSLEFLREETYFFRLSKYQEALSDAIRHQPDLIWPPAKRNEILSRLSEPVRDLSVSRTGFSWGIPFPLDKKHVFYVWMDALINYLSTLDFPSKKFERFWPARMHVIGRDIAWHHTAIWFAILFSAKLPLPRVTCHGFINTATGDKMSKSAGTVIDPLELGRTFGPDSVRYFLLREIPWGSDGRFSFDALRTRHNNELANDLGNLAFRTLSMIHRYYGGQIPRSALDEDFLRALDLASLDARMTDLEPHVALSEIFQFVARANKFINDTAPWKAGEADRARVLATLAEALRRIAIVLEPFLPTTSARLLAQLNTPLVLFSEIENSVLSGGHVLSAPEILFSKIESSPASSVAARNITVEVQPAVKDLGLIVVAGVLENVSVKKKHEGLERLKTQAVRDFAWSSEKEARVQGFESVYRRLGTGPAVNSVRNLRVLVEKSGQLPQINTAVDAYNIVSYKYALVVGAHDLDRVEGNVRFVLLSGTERYVPLFSKDPVPVRAGEFGVVDDKEVLCRLDVKQCDGTRVDKHTKNIVFYVQAQRGTPLELVQKARDEIGVLVTQFCGGRYRPL